MDEPANNESKPLDGTAQGKTMDAADDKDDSQFDDVRPALFDRWL